MLYLHQNITIEKHGEAFVVVRRLLVVAHAIVLEEAYGGETSILQGFGKLGIGIAHPPAVPV